MKGQDKEKKPEKVTKDASPEKAVQEVYPDFTDLINEENPKAYASQTGSKHFTVPTQMRILRQFCAKNKCTFRIRSVPTISALTHTVTTTVMIIGSNGMTIAEASSSSTKYAFNYAPMMREAATEIADTVSTGRALAKLGISPDGAFTSAEENVIFQFMKDNSSITEKQITHAANLFAGLSLEVKNMVKEKGQQITDLLSLVDGPNMTRALFEERVLAHLNTLKI
jgi:hypothetical protein